MSDGVYVFNDTATTEIYTLSLHDALPISHQTGQARQRRGGQRQHRQDQVAGGAVAEALRWQPAEDRKSTRLNSSHANISYAVFCLKKKKTPTLVVLPQPTFYINVSAKRSL